jgi:hypothetical protein
MGTNSIDFIVDGLTAMTAGESYAIVRFQPKDDATAATADVADSNGLAWAEAVIPGNADNFITCGSAGGAPYFTAMADASYAASCNYVGIHEQVCGPDNHSGGCCAGTTLEAGTSVTNCGTGGVPCVACGTGQACTNQACVCDTGAANSAGGCCANGAFVLYNDYNCGSSCVACEGDLHCHNGACS